MAFNITEFRDNLITDVANPTNYEVRLTRIPRILNGSDGTKIKNNFENLIRYRCDACSLPSKAFKYVNQTTYGPPRKVAYSTEFQDVTFSIIVTDSMIEKEYFALWQNKIVNNDLTFSNINTNNASYYDDYIGTIVINYFDKSGKVTYSVTFEEAYPIAVQEIPMSWHSNNDFIRLNVVIAYKYFVEQRYVSGIESTPRSAIDGVRKEPAKTKQIPINKENTIKEIKQTTKSSFTPAFKKMHRMMDTELSRFFVK